MTTYMLDTCICSFIMREHPASVIQRLSAEVEKGNRIVVSAVTYAEMRFGQVGKKASAKHKMLVDEFVKRLDAVLPLNRPAVDATSRIMRNLTSASTHIKANDTAIAGHAIASGCTLVTNNVRKYCRVKGLVYEVWSQ